ncbi:MAG: BatA domain-containing protein [Candidatus Zhuqueibacterota bacterium]
MTFLNSAILFGLLAGAIPIIIHLITRQKAKKIPFSSLKFLLELKNQQIKKLKLRQILLLILRTLIVLLLVLAFARPTVQGNFSLSRHASAKTSSVIILDNSLSMGIESNGQLLLEQAKQRILELRDSFRNGDEIFGLLAVNGAPEIFEGPRYNFDMAARLISKVRVSYKTTDIVSAIARAKEILSTVRDINKEIYLVTDLQRVGFESGKEMASALFEDNSIKLFIIPVRGDNVNNLVIEDVKPEDQIIEKGNVFELEAHIRNAGENAERNRLVQIFIAGKRSGQATVTVQPGESRTVKFRVIPQQVGLITGSILIEDDDLLLDNRRFFTFYVPAESNVLLVSRNEQDAYYLGLALNPGSLNSSVIRVETLRPDQIEFGTLNKFQVVVLANVPRIENALLSSLKNYVDNGGGLILFLGDEVDLKNYNATLHEQLSLPLFSETIGERGNTRDYLTLGKIDFSHPIFAGVFENSRHEIDSPSFYFLARSNTQSNHDRIIDFSNGEPLLVETQSGAGRILLFTTSVDPDWSDLYLKGMFVPVLNRCVAYLTGHASKSQQNYLVDEKVALTVDGVEDISRFQIKKPDASFIKVMPQIGDGNYRIVFEETDIAGIYSLISGEETVTEWAVNSNAAESDITPVETDELLRIVGGAKPFMIEKDASLAGIITASRFGKELWKYLVGLILILMILEMLIARERGVTSSESNVERFERTR